MLLKSTITVAAIALAMAMGVGTTYAQEKKSKKCKKTEKSCHKQDYGKPIDVVTKADKGAFAVIPLPYDYDAVADYIDAETMYILAQLEQSCSRYSLRFTKHRRGT